MAGHFDFLHIKKQSAGSPNELSFDVLDAARDQLDSKKTRAGRPIATPIGGQASYHGVVDSSTLSSAPEVAKRKKARRASAVRVGFVVAIAVIAALAGAGYYGWTLYQARVDYESRFALMISHLSDVDAQIVSIDQMMAGPVTATTQEERALQEKAVPDLLNRLERTRAEAAELSSSATRSEDEVALGLVGTTIDGREDMLVAADASLKLVDTFENDNSDATTLWARVIEADQIAREATELSNRASTEEAVEAASTQTRKAIDEFQAVLYAFQDTDDDLGKVDFSAQRKYLEKRIEALEHAVATGDALLAGDRDAAKRENDAYNAADKEAAKLAEELPPTLESQVRSLFTDELAALRSDYYAARSTVSEADADIRAYAGM